LRVPTREIQTKEPTEREKEILDVLVSTPGIQDKEMARKFNISQRTVQTHLRNIYAKLDVNSRTGATMWAKEHGFGADN